MSEMGNASAAIVVPVYRLVVASLLDRARALWCVVRGRTALLMGGAKEDRLQSVNGAPVKVSSPLRANPVRSTLELDLGEPFSLLLQVK